MITNGLLNIIHILVVILFTYYSLSFRDVLDLQAYMHRTDLFFISGADLEYTKKFFEISC